MNKKNILLAAAVFVVGQTYGAQPMNDLSTVAAVRACVTGQRVQAEQNAVQELVSAEISRRNNLGTFSRIAEDVFINPITACGSMLYGGIKNVGFYSYHFLKYPLVSVGLVTAGRSAGSVLQKEISDDTYKKLLFGGAAAGAIWAVYQAPKDIVKVKQIKDLKNDNKNLKTELYISAKLTADYASTHESLQRIEQQLTDQTAQLTDQTAQLRDQTAHLNNLKMEQKQTTKAIATAGQELAEVSNQVRGQTAHLKNLKIQQEQTTKAIQTAARELSKVEDELKQYKAQLSTIENQGLVVIEGQFVQALQGLLNSSIALNNSYIAINNLPENDSIRSNSIRMFANSLSGLNGLAGRAQKTLDTLKKLYPDIYAKLEESDIHLTITVPLTDNIRTLNTVPLTDNIRTLNKDAQKIFGIEQVEKVQQALEDRVEQDAAQLSLMAASSSSSSSTSSSSSSDSNTLPSMPVDSSLSSSVTTWSLSEAAANNVPRISLPEAKSFLSIMNSNKQNTSRLSTLPALTQQLNVNNFVIDDVD